MATIILDDAFFSATGNDLSDHVKSVAINYSAEMHDDTAMGDTTRSKKGGLKDWSMDVTFHQDYAASQVDAVFFPLVGTTFSVTARPDNSDGVGATNPNYTGTGILESYTPLTGSVGDLMEATISIQSAGALSRATS